MLDCPFCGNALVLDRGSTEAQLLAPCGGCFNPVLVTREGAGPRAAALSGAPDIRNLAPEGSIGHTILSALPGAMERLPVLPEISTKVLGLLRDENVSMSGLAAVIREDPAIALAIMKLANSPVYGGLQEIKDLNAACARLGLKTIANTVQVVANANLFITGDQRLKQVMRALWRHSIATAHSSFEIARLLAEPRSESLFLAGLLHDVGKVVLLDVVTGSYSGAIAKLRLTPELLDEVIQSFHGLVGLHVAWHWGLPAEIGAIIYAHHEPAGLPREEWRPLAHIVALGDGLAKIEGYGMKGKEEVMLLSHPSARFLNFNDLKLATLRVDLGEKLEAIFAAAG